MPYWVTPDGVLKPEMYHRKRRYCYQQYPEYSIPALTAPRQARVKGLCSGGWRHITGGLLGAGAEEELLHLSCQVLTRARIGQVQAVSLTSIV
jgi:hypothetical protein